MQALLIIRPVLQVSRQHKACSQSDDRQRP
jgi:hypothetical protein